MDERQGKNGGANAALHDALSISRSHLAVMRPSTSHSVWSTRPIKRRRKWLLSVRHSRGGQARHRADTQRAAREEITNRVAIPGRPLSLYSGAISPSIKSQSILPASCTSSCLMLMIWSSCARNRSPDPVVSCRIAPSDTATESRFSIRGNPENEIASFQRLRP